MPQSRQHKCMRQSLNQTAGKPLKNYTGRTEDIMKYFISVFILAGTLALSGCATTLPEAPKMTSEICRSVADKSMDYFPGSLGTILLYKDDKNALIGVNDSGWHDKGWYGSFFYNSCLYLSDIDGKNYHLVTKEPKDAPAIYDGSCLLQKAYIYQDNIYVEYNDRRYYKINKDGTGQESINVNEFYRFSISAFIPARVDFLKELTSALANKNYEKAESLRLYRIEKINWYLEKYIDDSSKLSGESKISHEMLLKEKEKLKNIVGLSDPALCQLREKYIAAINNDKYDDATKIFDLIERMERKYKPEPAQDIPQTVQFVQGEQPQLPQKIIVEHQEAPSTGKQMRALSTMAAGLDGGMTPKARNAWTSLFGLGDFIDASDKN